MEPSLVGMFIGWSSRIFCLIGSIQKKRAQSDKKDISIGDHTGTISAIFGSSVSEEKMYDI
jgi:hypothetical protein